MPHNDCSELEFVRRRRHRHYATQVHRPEHATRSGPNARGCAPKPLTVMYTASRPSSYQTCKVHAVGARTQTRDGCRLDKSARTACASVRILSPLDASVLNLPWQHGCWCIGSLARRRSLSVGGTCDHCVHLPLGRHHVHDLICLRRVQQPLDPYKGESSIIPPYHSSPRTPPLTSPSP